MEIVKLEDGRFKTPEGFIYNTEEAARNHCHSRKSLDESNQRFAALQLPVAISREEYETACAKLSVPALSDAEIESWGTALSYANWGMENGNGLLVSPIEHIEKMSLAEIRFHGIEAERKSMARPVQPQAEQTVLCACGHTVAKNLVMSASRGKVCPDCYDEWSD